MADNYLITGYWGEPHVTAENDRGINAAMFGAGRFVLPVGKQFKAEYIGNNTIRMYDGKLMDNGAAAGIPAGRYVDLLIPEAGQGMKRNDLIVFQYKKDKSTQVESGIFTVVNGTETAGDAQDPEIIQEDLLTDTAEMDQFPLWRIPVSATVISAPVRLFDVYDHTQYFFRGITTAGDGSAYTATVDGIAELKAGESFVMLPHTDSVSTSPTLNVNGLGAKTIRQRLSTNPSITAGLDSSGWIAAGMPVTVVYNGTYWVVEIPRPDANNLYGVVPLSKGGSGADNAEDARRNIGAAPAGYGLGSDSSAVDSWDNATANGFYKSNKGTPDGDGNYWHGIVCNYGGERCSQLVWKTWGDNFTIMATRRINDGVPEPWEWINPPMDTGAVYRTTRRYMGKPVYTKLIDCGTIPYNTRKNISYGNTDPGGVGTGAPIVVIEVVAGTNDGGSFPRFSGAGNTPNFTISTYASEMQIITTGMSGASSSKVYAQIWYTK